MLGSLTERQPPSCLLRILKNSRPRIDIHNSQLHSNVVTYPVNCPQRSPVGGPEFIDTAVVSELRC